MAQVGAPERPYFKAGVRLGDHIYDPWFHVVLGQASVENSVNYLQVRSALTANAPALEAQGADTNIGLLLIPKGTGVVTVSGPLAVTGTLDVTGATHLHSTLLVDGLGTFGAGVAVTGNVIATGLGKFGDVVVGGYGVTPANGTLSTASARLLIVDSADVLLPVAAGSLALSNSGGDVAPTNGLYVKGDAQLAATLKFTGTSQIIIPSVTQLTLRNNANTQSNAVFADAGDLTLFHSLLVSGTGLGAGSFAIATSAGGLSIAGNTLLSGTTHGVGLATFDGGVTLSANNLTFSGASQRIIPSTTALTLRNATNTTSNFIFADAGDLTIFHSLLVTGNALATNQFAIATSAGGISSAGDIAGATKLTITGASTLTGGVDSGLVVNSGDLTLTAGNLLFNGTSKAIIQPVTSLLFRDHANANTNLTLNDAGAATIRAGLTVTTGGVLIQNAGGLSVNGGTTLAGATTVSTGDFAVSAGKVTASNIGTFHDMKIGGNTTVGITQPGRISVVGSSDVYITTDADVLANLHNNSQVISNSGADAAPTNGLFTLGGIWLKGDPGTIAGGVGFSNVTAAPSGGGSRALVAQTAGGPGSVSVVSWLKIYIGTGTGYLPYFQ